MSFAIQDLQQEPVPNAKPSVSNINSVPDGGLTAWLQVLGSFFLFFNSWGLINSFGVFQAFYETGILTSSSPSDISWIGSIQSCLLLLVGAMTGPIYDRGYMRQLVAFGTFLIVFCHMMLSLCTEYWQVFLAQGIGIGLGTGCLFIPSVAIISTYFHKRLATAAGIVSAGGAIGGLVYPIVFSHLQPKIGFPWATRVMGFIALAALLVSNAVFRIRVLPAAKRRLLDLPAFKELPYLFITLGVFLGFMGLYTPFFYVQSFAINTGIVDKNLAFYLLSILNASSCVGRVVPNLVADKIGNLNILAPTSMIAGILGLCLVAVHNEGPLVAIIVLYGIFSGSFVSLAPTAIIAVTKNRAMIGTRMGQSFAVISIGILLGTPISGWILGASSFTYVWVWGGALTMAGATMIIVARFSMVGFVLKRKA
ncbi:MFS general substrate transporter [Polychaeton citri CBS 116435]|uniref:MFS general substrate transporter n=1 Tax=Polychaeton citri CBS 116435 TaxID=1314669 RepID=A0A9P4Q3G6_9PEZI|nr:MFS general substrate transporter [Polychaeton citri CBS 116435]